MMRPGVRLGQDAHCDVLILGSGAAALSCALRAAVDQLAGPAAGLDVDVIVGAEIARSYKPQPQAYLKSAEAVGLPPHEVALVAAHNDFRHQGIGRRLYEAFIDRARRLGEDEVEATTVPENSDAISFPDAWQV